MRVCTACGTIISTIRDSASSASDSAQLASDCARLLELCTQPVYASVALKAGALRLVEEYLLASDEVELNLAALRLLCLFARDEVSRIRILKSDQLVAAAMRLFERESIDVRIMSAAFVAVASRNEASHVLFLSLGVFEALVALLEQAVQAASHASRSSPVSMGAGAGDLGVRPRMALYLTASGEHVSLAVVAPPVLAALAQLCKIRATRERIAAAPAAISLLGELLASLSQQGTATSLHGLVALLSTLAEGTGSLTDDGNDPLVLALMRAGLMPALLRTVELAGTASARRRAATAELAAGPSGGVGASGGAEAGDSSAVSDASTVSAAVDMRRLAAHTLALCARYPACAAWFSDPDDVLQTRPRTLMFLADELLFRLGAGSGDAYTTVQALTAISLLAGHRTALPRAELVRETQVLLGSSTVAVQNPSLQGAVLMALTSLCASDVDGSAGTRTLVLGSLGAVLELLLSRHQGVQFFAAALMTTMAESEACRAAIGREDGLRPLFPLLRCRDAQVVVAALLAVGVLSLNLTNAIRLVEFGLLPDIKAHAQTREPHLMRVRFLASWVLVSLTVHATSESNRARLAEHDTLRCIAGVADEWRDIMTSIMAASLDRYAGSGQPSLPALPREYAIWRTEESFPIEYLTTLSLARASEVRSWLAWALSWLSFQTDYHASFVAGLVRTLAALVDSPSKHVYSGVALTLYNVCVSADAATLARLALDPRVEPMLNTLARSEYYEIRSFAEHTQRILASRAVRLTAA